MRLPAERDRLVDEPAALRRRRAFLELEVLRRGAGDADFGVEAERRLTDLLRLDDAALRVTAFLRRRTFRFPGEDFRRLLEGAFGTEAFLLRLREDLLLRLREADLERLGAFGVADFLLLRRPLDFRRAWRPLDRLRDGVLERLREGFFALRETRRPGLSARLVFFNFAALLAINSAFSSLYFLYFFVFWYASTFSMYSSLAACARTTKGACCFWLSFFHRDATSRITSVTSISGYSATT